jgi:nitrogen fixation/metabolism regulation signal transduction histidine kinase
MVVKLEESASVLARTEREGAWREMARQVAHEIKNPLTPMKLSMQFLQKSIDNKAPDIEKLANKVSQTLIEQIEHLTNIANAFSQFASIGDPKKEKFDVNEIIKNLVQMHETNDKIRIECLMLKEPVMIYADRTQIHRLFTNIMLNAIQSVPTDRVPEIAVSQYIEGGYIFVAVKDNGIGIAEDIAEKIFTPNFTTKSSGTGLGLAMCKRIAEQSEGDISFTTQINEGSVFVVKLPIAD